MPESIFHTDKLNLFTTEITNMVDFLRVEQTDNISKKQNKVIISKELLDILKNLKVREN